MLDEEAKAVGEVSKVADTLIKRISNAIGLCFEAPQKKRMAKAEVEVKKIEATAPFDIASAVIAKAEEFNDSKMTPIQRRAIARHYFEEGQKQENIESIVEQALPLLEEGAKPEEIKADWLNQFLDKAKLVSSEQMQKLWAKMLAGEANNHGSFSKRALALIETLEQKDAELFTSLCSFGWRMNTFMPLIYNPVAPIYNKEGITYASLKHLESIGLLSFGSISGFKVSELLKSRELQYYGSTVILEFQRGSKNTLDIGQVLLSQVGEELAPICGAVGTDEIRDYAIKHWESLGYKCTLL